MKPISQRHKVIGGVFVIVGVAWSLDMLTGGPLPPDAAASNNSALLPPKVELPPDPTDLDQIITALRQEQSTRQTLPFEQAARDVFTPADWFIEQTESAAEPISTKVDHASRAEAASVVFEKKHQLQGVLTGRIPLALIDGQLVREGARVDDYVLVEIKDDQVTFRNECERVILRVTPAGRP